ncbi:hypothetical protein ACFLYO_10240 [Chloroflexota bacterium]
MYDVRADTDKNRLYVVIEGYLTDPEVLDLIKDGKAGIDQLQPGFDVINDGRNYKPFSRKGTEYIVELLNYEIEHGRNRHVRIVDKVTLGEMQFERVTKDFDVAMLVVSSLEEAEKLLDE